MQHKYLVLFFISIFAFFPRSAHALILPDNSFLVMGSDSVTEVATIRVYDQQGLFIDDLNVPYPGVLDTIEPFAGDLIFHDNNLITVFNGKVDPYLSTYDIETNTWMHRNTPNWSGTGGSFGGIDILDNAIYVADTSIFFGGAQGTKSDPTEGIVKYDIQTETFESVGTTIGVQDVSVGDDGLLYVLGTSTTNQKLQILDPVSLNVIVETVVPNSPSLLQDRMHGVAADITGRIFLIGPDKVYEIDRSGNILNEIDFDRIRNNISGAPFDINVYNGNMLAVGDAFDTVTLYDLDLVQQDRFDGGFQFGSVYVEHVRYTPAAVIPEPSTTAMLILGLVGNLFYKRRA